MSVSKQDSQVVGTLYDVLQVSHNATMDEISRAYRQRAHQLHPDRNSDSESEELMKKLNTAKTVLLSNTERTRYDQELKQQKTPSMDMSAIFTPAGVLPFKSARFSEMLVTLYNQQKDSFERKHVPVLGEFQSTIKGALDQVLKEIHSMEPPQKAHYPQTTPSTAGYQQQSSLEEILHATRNAISDPHLCLMVQQICECVLHVQKMCQSQVSSQCSQPKGDTVPIWDVSCISNEHSHFFLSLFEETDMSSSKESCVKRLNTFIPQATVAELHKTPTLTKQNLCSACNNELAGVHNNCSQCGEQFCPQCPLQTRNISQLGHTAPQPLCLTCISEINAQEQESWIDKGTQLLKTGTLCAIRAALGCMFVASCIHSDHTKLIYSLANTLRLQGLHELAIPLTASLLKTLPNGKTHLKSQMMMGSILKSAAELAKEHFETQEFLFRSAHEAYVSAEVQASSLSSSIEVPNLKPKYTSISDKLDELKMKKQTDHQLQVNAIYSKIERHWYANDWKNLLVYITRNREDVPVVMEALENFLKSKSQVRKKPEDCFALTFLTGVLKIYQGNVSAGLTEIEKVVWKSRSQWLHEAAVEVVVSLLDEGAYPIFSEMLRTLKQVCLGGGNSLLADHEQISDDRSLALIFPGYHELSLPVEKNWPELSEVIGPLNVSRHATFENAIATQVKEEKMSTWEAGRSYVDYVPACMEPIEVALCFLHASFWFLKDLESARVSNDCHAFALKEVIVTCLKHVLGVASLRLHVGMQMYVSRLSLGVLLRTFRLMPRPSWTTNSDRELLAQLLHKILYTHRFCPLWQFPPVPLSEAKILDMKMSMFCSHFLLALQHVDPSQRPISGKELKYQLFENDLCHIQPLKDSEAIRAQAMLSLLEEKGWTWNDVITTMTSNFSPRDSKGWLIQQSTLGANMKYAKVEGFILHMHLHSPTIEVVMVPADASKGEVGLLSLEDVATVLQLDENEHYPLYFSLDPPCADQTCHPFQELRFSSEKKLENTGLLQTLFETDYLLKSFSVGSEVSSVPPFNQRPTNKGLTKNLSESLQEVLKPVAKRGPNIAKVSRFWIQLDDLVYDREQIGSRIEYRLKELDMKIRTHPLIAGLDGKLKDTEEAANLNSPEHQFANDLTTHYREIAIHFPMFARLCELSKLQFLGVVLQHELQRMRATDPNYHAFREQVSNLRTIANNYMKRCKAPNPCRWVPAAFDKEVHKEYMSLCYGGVLIAPNFKPGRVRPYSSGSIQVRINSSSFKQMSSSALAPTVTNPQKVLKMSSSLKATHSESSESGDGGSQSSSNGSANSSGNQQPSSKVLSARSTGTRFGSHTKAKSNGPNTLSQHGSVPQRRVSPNSTSNRGNKTSDFNHSKLASNSSRLTSQLPRTLTGATTKPMRPHGTISTPASSSSQYHGSTPRNTSSSSSMPHVLKGTSSSSRHHGSTPRKTNSSSSMPHSSTPTMNSSSSKPHTTSSRPAAISTGATAQSIPNNVNPPSTTTRSAAASEVTKLQSSVNTLSSTASTALMGPGDHDTSTLGSVSSTSNDLPIPILRSGNQTITDDILSQPWKKLAVSSNGHLGLNIYDVSWERLFGHDEQMLPSFSSDYEQVLRDGITYFCKSISDRYFTTDEIAHIFPGTSTSVGTTVLAPLGILAYSHQINDPGKALHPSTCIELVDEQTQLRHAAIALVHTNTPCSEYKRPCKCCQLILPKHTIFIITPYCRIEADIRVVDHVDCQTRGVVYAIIDMKTGEVVYIGMTIRKLLDRIREHWSAILKFDPLTDLDEKSIAKYFNTKSSKEYFRVVIIHTSPDATVESLREIETAWILYFKLIEFGLNKTISSKSGEESYKTKYKTTEDWPCADYVYND